MRIDRLELRAFGPFTDAPPLNFSQGAEGIHLVYGPNEAGKSTALRALTYALYGIPTRCPDDFIHPYSKLRIAMAVRANDATLAFVRRKGASNTLREYDDETNVIDELEWLVAETAAASTGTTAGRVIPQDLTGATAVLGGQILNRIGRALSAKTTANTDADLLVDLCML